MEQRETAQGVLDGVEQRLAETRDKRAATEQRRDDALAEIAKEEEFKRGARQPLAADLPADLVTLYDKIREDTGLGAALLTGGPLRRLPAGPVRRRPGPDPQGRPRRGGPLRGLPTDHGPHQRVGPVVVTPAWSSSRPTAGPGATPAPPATARWSATRTTGEVLAERCRVASARPPTTSPSTGG